MTRTYKFRTLRSDFIDLCDGNRVAALLLDYFWQQGLKHRERQSQGSTDSPFVPLGWNFAISILLLPVGKNAVKRGVAILAARGFITPHPGNGQSASNQVNSYRPNIVSIQAELNRWSIIDPYVWSDPPYVQTDPPWVYADPPSGSVQTHPLGLAGQQDIGSESVIESPSSSPAAPVAMTMTIQEIDELIGSLLGRRSTKAQQQQMFDMLTKHRPEQIRAAVDVAAANDKRSLAYVRAILQNSGGAVRAQGKVAAAPLIKLLPPEPEVELPPDEIEEMAAGLRAVRAQIKAGHP